MSKELDFINSCRPSIYIDDTEYRIEKEDCSEFTLDERCMLSGWVFGDSDELTRLRTAIEKLRSVRRVTRNNPALTYEPDPSGSLVKYEDIAAILQEVDG